ncbi:MFS transporter [Paenibacillus ehimensis]|uniref:MFS transporter n=1 Tax=Paenibacillus ehimensis TaxID=79264 RepID=UPI000FDC3D48|nr:MFS transporter [Paenibacillus ehimensis]
MINRLIWMGCLCYVITGVSTVIVGAVLPELLAHYSQSYGSGGMLIFVQFVGLLSGVLSMPAISRKLGRKSAVLLGLGLVGMELFAGLLPPWPAVVLLAGLAGFGTGLVESCIGTIILLAVKQKQAAAMSKLEVTFGVGALVMPSIASFLIAKGLWTYSFFLLGTGALATAIVWRRMSFGEMDGMLARKEAESGGGQTQRPAYARSGIPFLALCAVFFFLYGGSEVSVVHFFPSIFMERWGIDSSLATLTVTVYWTAMVIGRILTGILGDRWTYFRFLWAATLLSLAALLVLPFSHYAWGGYVLSFLLGLGMSGMFAVALIYANQSLPGMTERTTSILLAANGLGGSLLPLGVGRVMDAFPIQTAMWLYSAVMLVMLVVLTISKRRPQPESAPLHAGRSME